MNVFKKLVAGFLFIGLFSGSCKAMSREVKGALYTLAGGVVIRATVGAAVRRWCKHRAVKQELQRGQDRLGRVNQVVDTQQDDLAKGYVEEVLGHSRLARNVEDLTVKEDYAKRDMSNFLTEPLVPQMAPFFEVTPLSLGSFATGLFIGSCCLLEGHLQSKYGESMFENKSFLKGLRDVLLPNPLVLLF